MVPRQFEMALPGKDGLPTEDVDAAWERVLSLQDEAWIEDLGLGSGDDNDGWMLMFRVSGEQWVVSCCGKTDAVEHYLVTNSHEGVKGSVQVRKCGTTETIPTKLLVPSAVAKAAFLFYATGFDRDPSLNWVPLDVAFD